MVNHTLIVIACYPGVCPTQYYYAEYCFNDVTYLFFVLVFVPNGRLRPYLLEELLIDGVARIHKYWDVESLHTIDCCVIIDPISFEIATTQR